MSTLITKPEKLLAGALGLWILLPGAAAQAATEAGVAPDTATPPVQLIRISPVWQSAPVGAIGLPSLTGGVVRYATEDALFEGPPLAVRAAIRTSTWIPERTDAYSFFERDLDRLNYDLMGSDRGMTFVGRSRKGDVGIYSIQTNKQERAWVRAHTAIPEGTGNFERFQFPFTQGDAAVFIGHGENGQKGVYRATKAGVERVADASTLVPGREMSFRDFSYARILSNGAVVFTGYSVAGSGLYKYQAGELSTLVDRRTTEPTTRQPYAGALLVGAEDGWVYFTSFGGTLSIGRVRDDGSSVETLVRDTTQLPDLNAKVGAINYASIQQGRVLFEAAAKGNEFNLYLWDKGSVRPLVQRGADLAGGKIVAVRSGLQALQGNRFVCLADVQGEDPGSFQRAVYLGELTPGGATIVNAIATKTEERSWFRLGFGPIPVFAREAGSSTNSAITPLGSAKP